MSGRSGAIARATGRALAGGGGALLLAAAPWPGGPERWIRTNHRGESVSLCSGPALAVAAALTSGPAAALAGLVSAACGAYDDVAGARPVEARDKGLRGHLGALRSGRVSAGTVKVVGIGSAGVLAVLLLPGRRGAIDTLVGAGVVATSANLLNLLDLRPGRALKVGMTVSLLLGRPGPLGAATALLPADLGERQMLGDTGANALGAVLGTALVARGSRRSALAALAALGGLTLASEVVSFSAVIDRQPVLRALDRLGRR